MFGRVRALLDDYAGGRRRWTVTVEDGAVRVGGAGAARPGLAGLTRAGAAQGTLNRQARPWGSSS
ncbi:hypothetical protein GCM10023148_52540 [Actinokineospora soli]